MSEMVPAKVVLRKHEVDQLQVKLHVVPHFLNGVPFRTKVRRGAIERRRLSLVKADKNNTKLLTSQELYRLCRFRDGEFKTIGWAIRSTISGDYFVYSESW